MTTVQEKSDVTGTVSVDVTGAKRLRLLVEFADHGDVQDHANWLDARVVR